MDCQKIGDIISNKRKEKQMTQKDLANILNISDRTISKWERGLGCPDITLLIPLSSALDIGLYELLGGEEMEKDSKKKANKILENTINISAKKIKRQNIIDNIIITISIIILVCITLFWLFVKFHYMVIHRPDGVKAATLIEYKQELSAHSCKLTLTNQECYFDDGTYIDIVDMEYRFKLPQWFARTGYYGFDFANLDENTKQISMVINEDDYKEKYINNYRIFDRNFTKKSMIVTSLVYFMFVEDLEEVYFDFGDNKYLIERKKIEKLLEDKYVRLDKLLEDDNWKKYVIKNLNNKEFVKSFFN